jgi:hypothetical protein
MLTAVTWLLLGFVAFLLFAQLKQGDANERVTQSIAQTQTDIALLQVHLP